MPTLRRTDSSASAGEVRVTVDDPDDCPTYLGVVFRGVKIGPSPAWLVNRLATVGIARPVSNVVDVTNYMLARLRTTGPRVRPRAVGRSGDPSPPRAGWRAADDPRRCGPHTRSVDAGDRRRRTRAGCRGRHRRTGQRNHRGHDRHRTGARRVRPEARPRRATRTWRINRCVVPLRASRAPDAARRGVSDGGEAHGRTDRCAGERANRAHRPCRPASASGHAAGRSCRPGARGHCAQLGIREATGLGRLLHDGGRGLRRGHRAQLAGRHAGGDRSRRGGRQAPWLRYLPGHTPPVPIGDRP